MRGLVDFALSGLDKNKYRSNGNFFNGDSLALSIFEPIFRNNEKELMPIFKEIQAFYNAGQTTEDWLLAKGKAASLEKVPAVEDGDIYEYFSTYREGTIYEFKKIDDKGTLQLESVDRSFFTPYAPGELNSYLRNLNHIELIARVKAIIKLGGGTLDQNFNRPAELFAHMQKNPTLRANYMRGLNLIAMTPNRAEYFRTGKLEAGISADKATKLVDYLKDAKNLTKIREGFQKAIEADKKGVEANTNLTPEQKKNILD